MLHPGEFFGDISLVNDQPVTAYVIASGSCLCQVLYKDQYDILKFRHPEFEGLLMAAMTKRNYRQLPPFLTPPSILSNLSGGLARAMVEKMMFETIKAGANVLTEGKPHDGLFIVARGEVEAEIQILKGLGKFRSTDLFVPPESCSSDST